MQIPWTKEEIDTAIRLAKEGMKATEIATHLKGRTRNAVIGLLHRRKIMMSIFQSKPYPTRPPRVARKKPSLPQPKVEKEPEKKKQPSEPIDYLFEKKVDFVKYGKTEITDAHSSQCRWIDGEGTIVCGEPIVKNSAWCKDHYRRVYTPYSVAKAAAEEIKRKRELEKWPERKRF